MNMHNTKRYLIFFCLTHFSIKLIGRSNTTSTYSPTFVLTAGSAFGKFLMASLNCILVSSESETFEDI